MKFSATLLSALALASTTFAHMEMSSPPPRNSKFNKVFQGDIDYSMTAPLGAFPCKGYGAGASVSTFKAGSSIPVSIIGGAPHNGGHCQFSLSYDGGATFVVLHTVMGECLRGAGNNFSVQIPQNAPSSDKVVFAWTWVNRTGNREYYMNCADISIEGSANGSITGPKLTVANLPGYPTIPEFTTGGYDGSDIYSQAPTITVGGNGSAPQPIPPVVSSAAPVPSPSAAPISSAAPAPVTSAAPISSAPVISEAPASSYPVVSQPPVAVPTPSSSVYVQPPVASSEPAPASSYIVEKPSYAPVVPSPAPSAQPPVQSPVAPVVGSYDDGKWDAKKYGWEAYKNQYNDGSYKDQH